MAGPARILCVTSAFAAMMVAWGGVWPAYEMLWVMVGLLICLAIVGTSWVATGLERWRIVSARERVEVVALAVGGIVLAGTWVPAARLAGIACVLCGMATMAAGPDPVTWRRLASAAVLLSGCRALLDASATGWWVWKGAATLVSAGVGGLLQSQVDFGPTALGMDIALVAVTVAWASMGPTGRWVAYGLGALLLLHGVIVGVMGGRVSDVGVTYEQGPQWFLGRPILAGVTILALGVGAWLSPSPSPSRVQVAAPSRGIRPIQLTAWCAVPLLLYCGTVGGRAAWSPLAGSRVFIHNDGLISFRAVPDQAYGWKKRESAARLVGLLEVAGCTVDSGSLTPDVFMGRARPDVVFVDCPTRSLDAATIAALEGFVRLGGGLLVAGDHTNVSGVMGPTNEIIERFGITLRFDSAFPSQRPWPMVGRWSSHPVAAACRDRPETSILVGASLEVRPPARPVFVAPYGLGDRGVDVDKEQLFLGDRHYESGDRLGDIVLVATASHGKGSVAVVGDGNPFVSSGAAFNACFLRSLVAYLANPRGFDRWPWLEALALGCAMWLSVGMAVCALEAGRTVMALGAGMLTFVCCTPEPLSTLEEQPGHAGKRLMLIDTALLEAPSLDPWGRVSAVGLATSAGRSSMVAIADRALGESAVPRCAGLAIVDPKKDLGRGLADRVLDHVAAGGHVLLGIDPEGARRLRHLLEPLGIEVLWTPIGTVPYSDDQASVNVDSLQFACAWELKLPPNGVVLAEYQGMPIAGEVTHGAGSVVVVADKAFLTSRRLENESSGFPTNVEFVVKILERWTRP